MLDSVRNAAALMVAATLSCGAGKSEPPETGSWKLMSPGPVFASLVPEYVWTGTEMVVWGQLPGLCDPSAPPPCIGATGARYNPSTDRWTSISLMGLSSDFFRGRTGAVGIWTGKEVLVWGGNCPESVVCGGGAAYDPAQDHWRTMSDL